MTFLSDLAWLHRGEFFPLAGCRFLECSIHKNFCVGCPNFLDHSIFVAGYRFLFFRYFCAVTHRSEEPIPKKVDFFGQLFVGNERSIPFHSEGSYDP